MQSYTVTDGQSRSTMYIIHRLCLHCRTTHYTACNDNTQRTSRFLARRVAILESATNLWLLVLSLLHKKRIIKQASLSHWVAEYNLKVSSAWDYTLRPNVIVTLAWLYGWRGCAAWLCKMEITSNHKVVADSNIAHRTTPVQKDATHRTSSQIIKPIVTRHKDPRAYCNCVSYLPEWIIHCESIGYISAVKWPHYHSVIISDSHRRDVGVIYG